MPRVSNGIALRRLVWIVGSVLAACCGLLLQSAAALAAGAYDPVVIDDCRIRNARSYVSSYEPIELVFRNLRAAPAVEIHFTVEYAGRTEHIVDRGTFSQNVEVDHAFEGFYNAPYRDSPPSCGVDYVRFRGGGVWRAAGSFSAPRCPSSRPAHG